MGIYLTQENLRRITTHNWRITARMENIRPKTTKEMGRRLCVSLLAVTTNLSRVWFGGGL